MPKYRKKPVEVEAWQFKGTLDGAPEWVKHSTLSSLVLRINGNWWVRLPDGRIQFWSDENFAAAYEPVEA